MEAAEDALGHPLEHTHPTYFGELLEMAQSLDARTLISGFGGDEVVSNNGMKVQIWLRRNGYYRQLIQAQNGRLPRRLIRFLNRLRKDIPTGQQAAWITQLCDTALVNSEHLECLQEAQPSNDEHSRWAEDPNAGLLKNPLFATWRFARLEACSIIGFSLGVEFRWPLLDPSNIQAYLASPPLARFNKGRTRYLYRSAISDHVPKQIAWRNKKSLGASMYVNDDIDDADRPEFGALHPMLQDILDEPKLRSAQDTVGRLEASSALQPEVWEVQRCLWRVSRVSNWLYKLSS